MATANLTAARLRELLDYDPASGKLTRAAPAGGQKVGDEAGSVTRRGYRLVNIAGHRVMAHRLAWLHAYGEWPSDVIDHINGDKLDNRIANLRNVTQGVNLQNLRRARVDSQSGLLGVHFDKSRGKWSADLRVGSKRLRLGRFDSAEAAATAYLEAKRIHHPGCAI